MNCKVGGCPTRVEPRLERQALCLDHFVGDVQDRCHRFAHRLAEEDLSEALQRETSQFVIFAAAKIASIGAEHPPPSQLMRGKMLNVMLMLADLRERLDRMTAEIAGKTG
ncbi:MAG: hypothetical protein ACE5MH_01120 [Terriglobia bacterium]